MAVLISEFEVAPGAAPQAANPPASEAAKNKDGARGEHPRPEELMHLMERERQRKERVRAH